jgi:ABC-type uncharacterized transport system involved in gliding motility auxiliary subunit
MKKIFSQLKTINLIKILKLEKLESSFIIFLSLAVFVLLNLLLSTFSLRLDLSEGKVYSLSSSTKKILKNLDDLVTIKFFVSSDLPTRLLPLKNDVLDFLNEYKKATGKISVKVLDPKKDEKALQEAKEIGLPELQFSQLEKDKYAVTNVYFGIVISYTDKKEILPQVTELESLEYNITSSIYKLTKKQLDKIAILGKEQKFNPQEDDLLTFKKIAERQFVLDFIDVSTASATKSIDSSYKTILVFDTNQKEYDSQEIAAIKDYLQDKGKAIFFVDGVWVGEDLNVTEAKHNLFSIIKDYGLQVNQDLVLSTSAELVNFGNQMVQFLTTYPYWLKTNNFNFKTPYFSNINQLTFPWVSSLKVEKKNNLKIEELVKTTKRSWNQQNPTAQVLNPQNIPNPSASDLKEFLITAYAKKENQGEIVVIPSSRFILERFLGRASDNLEFILNLLNNLASGGALSGIRQRSVSLYLLPDLNEAQKDLFRYLNILLLPSLWAVFGAIRLLKRK